MFKYFKIVTVVILGIMVQIGFLSALGIDQFLNLPLLILVFSILFLEKDLILVVAVATGLLFDIYLSYFFGFFVLVAMAEWWLIFFLSGKVLQNRNIKVFLLLNVTAQVVWHGLYLAPIYIQAKLGGVEFGSIIEAKYFISAWWQLVVHAGLVLALYWLVPGFKRILKAETIH